MGNEGNKGNKHQSALNTTNNKFQTDVKIRQRVCPPNSITGERFRVLLPHLCFFSSFLATITWQGVLKIFKFAGKEKVKKSVKNPKIEREKDDCITVLK